MFYFLIASSLIGLQPAHGTTLVATGTDAAICNQELTSSTGVVAQRLPNGDCLIAFTSTSTTTVWTAPNDLYIVDYLVVGGGGGGATGYDSAGGGGGGGGMLLTDSLALSPGSNHDVSIGAGGNGGANARANNWGANGGSTIFSSVTATGGQGGYGSRSAPGGARAGGAAQNGSITSGRGGNGGTGGSGGGGGGGAAGVGGSGVVSGGGGNGGSGISSSFTGTSVTFSSGGSGGSAISAVSGSSAASNTGRGGNAGGGANASSGGGGNGGSGVVYLKYSTTPIAFNSLGVQGGASTAVFRRNVTLEGNIASPGTITFYADGKRIPRCANMDASGSGSNFLATCTWQPSRRGAVRISALAKPTAALFANRTSTQITVVNRTSRR